MCSLTTVIDPPCALTEVSADGDVSDEGGIVHEVGEEVHGVGGSGQLLEAVSELGVAHGLHDRLRDGHGVLLLHQRLHLRPEHVLSTRVVALVLMQHHYIK